MKTRVGSLPARGYHRSRKRKICRRTGRTDEWHRALRIPSIYNINVSLKKSSKWYQLEMKGVQNNNYENMLTLTMTETRPRNQTSTKEQKSIIHTHLLLFQLLGSLFVLCHAQEGVVYHPPCRQHQFPVQSGVAARRGLPHRFSSFRMNITRSSATFGG